MNAIAPVPQIQPGSDTGPLKPSEAPDSSNTGTVAQDFTSAMHAAGKPTRKTAPAIAADPTPSGNAPPASGIQPPLAAVLNALGNAANAVVNATNSDPQFGATAAGTAAVKTPAATAPGPLPDAHAPNAEPPGAAAVAIPFAQLIDLPAANAPTAAATPPVIDASAATTAASFELPRGVEAVAPSFAAPVVHANPTGTGTTATATKATAATAVTSGLNPSSTTAGAEATPSTDAAAQTSMAAAASVGASSSDRAAAQNFLGAPDTIKPTDVPGADAPGAGAPGATDMPPVTALIQPAAVTAAAAHLATSQAISAVAGVSVDAAGKPSHGNTTDPSPSLISSAAGAGAAQLLSSSGTDASTAPTFKIPAPVETADFSQGLADRVSFMVDGNISSAKLQINPPALGPIEVRIALQGSHAQVSFTSHSALTRDALESSAPKLREMLGAQGFGQVSVDVSQGGSFHDRAAQSSPYQVSAAGAREAGAETAQSLPRTAARLATSVLDAYA